MTNPYSNLTLTEVEKEIAETKIAWSALWNKIGVRAGLLEEQLALLEEHAKTLRA